MKSSDFDYHRPENLADALQLLALSGHDNIVLAGGQSLMPMMHLRLARPDALVDLNRISELDYIELNGDQIEIGSMCRYATLESSPLIAQHVPLIAKAIPFIAHAAIRNRGTIGGSAALADPAAEMPALLVALNAKLTLSSLDGDRELRADDFFTGLYETELGDNEIIKSVSIPCRTEQTCSGFYEITRRHGDYAMAGVAMTASQQKPLHQLRIVFFGIAECAVRAPDCEAVLENKHLDDADAVAAAKTALDNLDCLDDLHGNADTKRRFAKVALGRALQEMQS